MVHHQLLAWYIQLPFSGVKMFDAALGRGGILAQGGLTNIYIYIYIYLFICIIINNIIIRLLAYMLFRLCSLDVYTRCFQTGASSEASAATYRYVVDLEHRFIARKCPGMIFSPRSPAFRAFARSCASFVPEAKNGRLCLGDEK